MLPAPPVPPEPLSPPLPLEPSSLLPQPKDSMPAAAVTTSACLIDMDGVLYQGEQAIAGAAGTVNWLVASDIPHLFLTNTTSRPRSALQEKLGRMGMDVDTGRILTPPVAASRWLAVTSALQIER